MAKVLDFCPSATKISNEREESTIKISQENEPSSTAATKDASRSSGTPEAKGGFTEPPAAFQPVEPIISIRDRLARIVHRESERMESGEIDEVLSEQLNAKLQQLASFV